MSAGLFPYLGSLDLIDFGREQVLRMQSLAKLDLVGIQKRQEGSRREGPGFGETEQRLKLDEVKTKLTEQ